MRVLVDDLLLRENVAELHGWIARDGETGRRLAPIRGRVMNRLTVVAVAALIAIASGLGLVRYVVRRRGSGDRPTPSPVAVLVAAADVADGTSFADAWDDGRHRPIARSSQGMRPPTAIADPAELDGTVMDGVLRQGQLVVQGVFVAPKDAGDAGLPADLRRHPPRRHRGGGLRGGRRPGGVRPRSAPATASTCSCRCRTRPSSACPTRADRRWCTRSRTSGSSPSGRRWPRPRARRHRCANPGAGSYTVAVSPRDAARLLLLTRQYEVFLTLVGPGATLRRPGAR